MLDLMTHPARHAISWHDFRALALDHHGVVTFGDALACGCTKSALNRAVARSELVRLAPRTLAIPELLDDRSHLAAACLSEQGAVASHRAAALLLDLDGVDEDVVELSRRGGVRSRHGRTHRSSDLLRRDITVVDTIPTTNATRTCCDLGKVAPLEVVERVVESALRQRATTLHRLETRMLELARPGRPGPATLRRVLALRGAQAATESDFETLAIQCFRAAHVPEPERQYVVRHRGRFVARTDLAWPEARVYGELDGREHHEEWVDTVRDRKRQNALARAGWMPARFTWAMIVYDGPATAAELLGILDERMREAS